MTPRLRLSHHDRGWSELFKPAHSLRKMRVMADAELLSGDPDALTIENTLAGLLTHEDIQFWRYSDDGPPPGTAQVTSMSGERVARGWVVAKPAPPGSLTTHTVAWSVGELGFLTGL